MVTGMYSYETYASKNASRRDKKEERKNVGYFKLIDDGDEALVRFDYTNPSELMLAHVHDEPVANNKHRRVLCLRENARDDMSKCPLCARGDKYFAKVYLKLIEYSRNEQGRIDVHAKIWERPASFSDTIAEYINTYGGLHDVVFKIKRVGAKGSKDTQYIMTPLPSPMYSEDKGYVKDFSDFEDFKLYPHSFLSKSKEDIEEYIRTGDFPFHKKSEDETTTTTVEPTPLVEVAPMEIPPLVQAPQVTPQVTSQPMEAETPSSPIMDRPRRRYDYN